jgi:hypothetical protein
MGEQPCLWVQDFFCHTHNGGVIDVDDEGDDFRLLLQQLLLPTTALNLVSGTFLDDPHQMSNLTSC